MKEISKEIFNNYQIRNTKYQKEEFRNYIINKLKDSGYDVNIQSKRNTHNIIIGDINNAKVIFTAHYDTCSVLPFPNLIVPNNLFGFIFSQILVCVMLFLFVGIISIIPYMLLSMINLEGIAFSLAMLFMLLWMFFGKANKHTANDNTSGVITIIEILLSLNEELKNGVCFILFDNEEKGLIGSSIFAKEYKNIIKDKLIINFDCVADGDNLFFFPSKSIKGDSEIKNIINKSYTSSNGKKIFINDGFSFYPSDNLNFNKSFGVCSLKKKVFYYMDRIHTSKDIIFDENNIELLSNGSIKFIKEYINHQH